MIGGPTKDTPNKVMGRLAAEASSIPAEQGPIRFEQPLTERMRTFLRVEFLYQQARFHADDEADFGTRATVATLLELLTILGRGDVRAEVMKELDRHADLLIHHQRTPGIDVERLNSLIDDVDTLREQLAAVGNQFMNSLKENEFLNTIKHRSAIPGGTCNFDLPDYGYWLHLPAAERAQHLQIWIDQLRPLCEAVAEVLWLVREATEPVECVAYNGMYHNNLDRNVQFNMARVLLPHTSGLYPEISAGQHRITVRFVEWRGVDARPAQTAQDVPFVLTLC